MMEKLRAPKTQRIRRMRFLNKEINQDECRFRDRLVANFSSNLKIKLKTTLDEVDKHIEEVKRYLPLLDKGRYGEASSSR
ncbi:unnamed protein product [Rhizophagus irregularis]|nr:unnamed protein product [Rhizophagus irregularis]